MSIKVRIPTPLRKLTNGSDEVTAAGKNVAEIIEDLEKTYPGLKERICEGDGKLRRFVNIYLNDEDMEAQLEEKGVSHLSEGTGQGTAPLPGREELRGRDQYQAGERI
ncbi:MAG: MoaD/ThiS family protein [Deltaproteobacteria bacterium]|nr:MoaD/ThiS family protein [Deltaproteobacteria bacterium]